MGEKKRVKRMIEEEVRKIVLEKQTGIISGDLQRWANIGIIHSTETPSSERGAPVGVIANTEDSSDTKKNKGWIVTRNDFLFESTFPPNTTTALFSSGELDGRVYLLAGEGSFTKEEIQIYTFRSKKVEKFTRGKQYALRVIDPNYIQTISRRARNVVEKVIQAKQEHLGELVEKYCEKVSHQQKIPARKALSGIKRFLLKGKKVLPYVVRDLETLTIERDEFIVPQGYHGLAVDFSELEKEFENHFGEKPSYKGHHPNI